MSRVQHHHAMGIRMRKKECHDLWDFESLLEASRWVCVITMWYSSK